MVKRKKKREKFLVHETTAGIPWEYLSRMRSTVGTTGSCTENHTGSRFHQDLKARTRSRWYRKKRMKGWKKDGDTDRGWTHHCFSTHFLSTVLSKTMHALPLTISIALCWTDIVFLFLLVGMSLRSLSKSPSWRLVFELKWKFTVWTDVESLFPRRNFSSTLFRCPEIRAGKIKTTCPPAGNVLFLLGEASVHRETSYGIYIEEILEISFN